MTLYLLCAEVNNEFTKEWTLHPSKRLIIQIDPPNTNHKSESEDIRKKITLAGVSRKTVNNRIRTGVRGMMELLNTEHFGSLWYNNIGSDGKQTGLERTDDNVNKNIETKKDSKENSRKKKHCRTNAECLLYSLDGPSC